MEESRSGYHLVRTKRGDTVHLRAKELVHVSVVCADGSDSDELDEEDFATYLPTTTDMMLDCLDAAGSGSSASEGAFYGLRSPVRAEKGRNRACPQPARQVRGEPHYIY